VTIRAGWADKYTPVERKRWGAEGILGQVFAELE